MASELEITLDLQPERNELDKTIVKIKELDKEAKEAGIVITKSFKKSKTEQKKFADSTKQSTQEVKKLTKNIKEVGRASKKTGDQSATASKKISGGFKGIVKTIAKLVGLTVVLEGLRRGLVALVRSQAQFQAGLGELSAITGAVGKDLEFYRKSALEVAKSNDFGTISATEFLNALKLVGSAKPELLSTKEALVETTKAAILLSQASGDILEQSTASLTDVMNQFSKEANEAADVVNVLAAGSKFGAGSIQFLGQSIVQVGTVAKNANINLEQTVGLLEVLAKNGISAEKSGTGLRNVILALQADTENYTDGVFDVNLALERLSKIQGDSIKLQKQFGKENVVVATILAQNISLFDELTSAVTGTNTATEQASVRTNNLNDNWDRLKNTAQAIFIGTGFLATGLNNLVKGLDKTLGGTQDLRSENQKLISSLTEVRLNLERDVQVLESGNLSTEARKLFIKELNEEYQDYLPSLIEEADSMEQIKTKTDAANKSLLTRTVLLSKQQELEKLSFSLVKARGGAIAGEISLSKQEQDVINARRATEQQIPGQQQFLEDQLNINRNITKAQSAAADEIIAGADKAREDIEEKYEAIAESLGLILNLDDLKDTATETTKLTIELTDKQKNEIKRIQQELNKDLSSLQKQSQKAQLELASDDERIRLISDFASEAISILEKELLDRKEKLGKARELTEEEEKQFAVIRLSIERKFIEDIVKLTSDREKKQIDLAQAQAELEVALLEKSGDDQIDLEEFKQRRIIEINIEAAKKRLALIDDQGSLEALKLKKQIADSTTDLKEEIEESDLSIGGDLLKKLFEVSDEDAEEIAEALRFASGAVLDAFTAGLDEAIDKNQQFIDALNDRISTLQDVVDEEKRLNEEGFANNLDIRQKELAALQADRDTAIAQQEEAVKKQQLLDKILVNSKLAVAIAQILATSAALGPLGAIVAGAAITALLNLFSNSIAKANTVSLAKGGSGSHTGIITGKSHSQGGESFLDQVEVQKGEAWGVLNRDASAKYGDLFHNFTNSLNTGNPMSLFTAPDLSRFKDISDQKDRYISNTISTLKMERNQVQGNRYLKTMSDKRSPVQTDNRTVSYVGNKTIINRH